MKLAPLIGRADETEVLLDLWSDVTKGGARLAIVHGPRQVGKTFLLAHLVDHIRASGGRAVLATALSGASVAQQLSSLVETLRRCLPDEAPLVPDRFAHWPAAFDWLLAMAERNPITVVLDEVPWYIATTRAWPSHLQVAWDEVRRQKRPPRLLLVLTGSAVATMRELMGGSGPLFGRADRDLTVDPLSLPTAAQFLPAATPETVIEAYAACGGYPIHLRAWDSGLSTKQNLELLAASPGGVLTRTGERMLADIPEDGGHRRVLHAIGSGETSRAGVGRQVGQRLERNIDLLLRAGLVRIDRPLGSPDRVPGRYQVTDTYLQFWYELCWADLGLIDGGQGQQVLGRRWPRWQRHLGRVFEEQARVHAVRLAAAGLLPREAVYGRWWTTSGVQVELDVIGLIGNRTVMVGEAKWNDRPVGIGGLADLRRRAASAPEPVTDIQLVFWCRGAVDQQVHAAGLRVFGPSEMVAQPQM